MQAGVDGLLRDKTRPSRIPPLGSEFAERVVTLTATTDPPGEAAHWTAAAMAKAVGISVSSVQRIWRAHGLQPHRVRRFKLSKDPSSPPNCATSSGSEPVLGPAKGRTRVSIRRRTRSCCRGREVADPGPQPYTAGAAD